MHVELRCSSADRTYVIVVVASVSSTQYLLCICLTLCHLFVLRGKTERADGSFAREHRGLKVRFLSSP